MTEEDKTTQIVDLEKLREGCGTARAHLLNLLEHPGWKVYAGLLKLSVDKSLSDLKEPKQPPEHYVRSSGAYAALAAVQTLIPDNIKQLDAQINQATRKVESLKVRNGK